MGDRFLSAWWAALHASRMWGCCVRVVACPNGTFEICFGAETRPWHRVVARTANPALWRV